MINTSKRFIYTSDYTASRKLLNMGLTCIEDKDGWTFINEPKKMTFDKVDNIVYTDILKFTR